MAVPRFSLERLASYVERRFDGSTMKLLARLQELGGADKWNESRLRRLLRGETRFDQDDLAIFQAALYLDSINDLYEVN